MAEGMDDFVRRVGGARSAGPWEATVTEDLSSVEDDLFATPIGSTLSDGPCYWSPRVDDAGAVVYPSRGDRVLITESDQGDYWVMNWTPYA